VPDAQQNVDALTRLLPDAVLLRDTFDDLRVRANRDPALATLVTPQRLKLALSRKSEMNSLVADLKDWAIAHPGGQV
jgi:hypothetical protein